MGEAAVTFLMEKTAQVLIHYLNLIDGADNELRQLQNELRSLKAFLKETGKKQKMTEPFKELERQIREVVYDVEDTIDFCLTSAAQAPSKPKSRFRKFINRTAQAPNRISLAEEVHSLRLNKVVPMLEQARQDFATMPADGPATDFGISREPPAITLDKVVALEDEEVRIKGWLREETNELDVISIIGMPGLGKTTFALKIFQDKKIQYEFPVHIWVYVSQEFSLKEILLEILRYFTNLDMSHNNITELRQSVRNYLEQQGKFLLVMDDVWDTETWDKIRPALPTNSMGSKVLITSRNENVGKHANPERKPHTLRFLTEDESWTLLQYEAFGKLDLCPKELKDTGKYIAKQCDGLPLAVVVIGGILAEKYSPNEIEWSQVINSWKKVSENVNSYINDDNSGSNKKKYNIQDIVTLSYKNLSDELRNCFLFLGLFPEDHKIPAWTLVQMWIAEGFIQYKDRETLEETAEGNLNDLINRNLVMIDERNPEGRVKTCRVHDVIREVCRSKAGEQNMFQEIKMHEDDVFKPLVSEREPHRRLSIHYHIPRFLSQKEVKGPKVRSFLCCNKSSFKLEKSHIGIIFEAFPLLRVLETKSFTFPHFPPKVTKLIHLRYVTLAFESLDVLPDSISELWNLQTLLVETKSPTLQIIGNVWKLSQLRHLKTKAAILLAAPEEANQKCLNLQTLTRVSPEHCTKEVLQRACNIKKLGIRGKLATLLDGGYSLNECIRLENLTMVNDLLHEAAVDNPLRTLPQSNFFPVNLRRLTLSGTYLQWDRMSTLGSISSLQILKLKENAFSGRSWDTDGQGFRGLKYLLISNSELVYWKPSYTSSDFRSLGCLVLKNCEHLTEIPETMAKSLKILNLERVGKKAVECAKKIKEEKLRHQQDREGGFKLELGTGCE